MSKPVWRRGGVSLAAVAVIAAVAGCQGQSDGGAAQSTSGAADVITAAFKKTSEAKSAKVRMTMSMPAGTGAAGNMEMNGVMGWDPTVMDMTMDGSALAADASAPDKIRMVWVNNVMYMDMGADAAKEMDGKRWMKLDLGAVAEASGDEAAQKQLAGGLENMNQDPAQQLALLLDSPNLKHLGSEKVDGVQAEHYKGTLTLDELVKSQGSLDVLSAKERADLLDSMKKSGLKGYDTEVWVNEDDYPVKMDVGMDTAQGDINISMHYSDYGAKAQVQAPPAGETFDFAGLLGGLGADGAGAAAS
ncbi:hypothetical protein [Streptomyces sp. 35G-GA-8]|uniref:hypothetical protein n=1 Tax=Streptomyces sp. 35G-GA-8 TaxID=2939434 RepID=UPI00201F3575|nr:hypothetical protein [Streptomyces sp. 35G-GA-8]MCL7376342.1 hypothetical protein [Streptomyces sp. 35G-GA-8]